METNKTTVKKAVRETAAQKKVRLEAEAKERRESEVRKRKAKAATAAKAKAMKKASDPKARKAAAKGAAKANPVTSGKKVVVEPYVRKTGLNYLKKADKVEVHNKSGSKSVVIPNEIIHDVFQFDADGGISLRKFKAFSKCLDGCTDSEKKARKKTYNSVEENWKSWIASGEESKGIQGRAVKPDKGKYNKAEMSSILRFAVGGGLGRIALTLRIRRNQCLDTVSAERATSDVYSLSNRDMTYLATFCPTLKGVKGDREKGLSGIPRCSVEELVAFLSGYTTETVRSILTGMVFTRDHNGAALFSKEKKVSNKERSMAESEGGRSKPNPNAAERRKRAETEALAAEAAAESEGRLAAERMEKRMRLRAKAEMVRASLQTLTNMVKGSKGRRRDELLADIAAAKARVTSLEEQAASIKIPVATVPTE